MMMRSKSLCLLLLLSATITTWTDAQEPEAESTTTAEETTPFVDTSSPEECTERAEAGECSSQIELMIQSCLSTCVERDDFGTVGYFPDHADEEEEEEEKEECVNHHEDCEEYAEVMECSKNPDYMLEACPKACLMCITPETKTFTIGVRQEIPHSSYSAPQPILQNIIDTNTYMTQTVMADDDEYREIRRDCQNYDEHCSALAAEGRCENTEGNELYTFMMLNCAPACGACEIMDLILSCSPDEEVDIMGEGGLDRMFRRIVGEEELEEGVVMPDYTFNILSRPKNESSSSEEEDGAIDGPWVITLDDLLTDEECDKLIELGGIEGYETSTLEAEEEEDEIDLEYRTSKNSWCEDSCYEHETTRKVLEKLETLTGIPDSYSEHLQMLRYVPGQFYKEHHDYLPGSHDFPPGPRLITVFLYLNDVEEGGATRFTDLGGGRSVDVQPKKGSALIWPSVLSEDPLEIDERTYHEALPVVKGHKYGANAWFHLRQQKLDRCDYERWEEFEFLHDAAAEEEEDYYDENEEEEEEEEGKEGNDEL